MKRHGRLPRIYLVLGFLLMYLPIIVIIIYSFNQSKTSTIWGGVTLDWYHELVRDRDLLEAAKNSVILGLLSSVCAGVVGTIGAVGMNNVELPANHVVEYLAVLPLMTPEIILGMVLMVFFSLIGLPFGMFTLVLAHTTFCIPYVFLMVKARLAGMDASYEEAARDLGASKLRSFLDITFPLIAPAILSGMLLSLAMSLDDVVISIFVTGATTNTLPIMVYTHLKTGVTPEINALCTVQLIVTLLLVGSAGFITYIQDRREKQKSQEEQDEN